MSKQVNDVEYCWIVKKWSQYALFTYNWAYSKYITGLPSTEIHFAINFVSISEVDLHFLCTTFEMLVWTKEVKYSIHNRSIVRIW